MDGAGITERFLAKLTLESRLEGQINISQAERMVVGAERRKHRDSVHVGGAAASHLVSKASVEATRDGPRGPGPERLPERSGV